MLPEYYFHPHLSHPSLLMASFVFRAVSVPDDVTLSSDVFYGTPKFCNNFRILITRLLMVKLSRMVLVDQFVIHFGTPRNGGYIYTPVASVPPNACFPQPADGFEPNFGDVLL